MQQQLNNVVQKLAQQCSSAEEMYEKLDVFVREEKLLYVSDDSAEDLVEEALAAQQQRRLF
jgi:hypothetical protein